MLNTNIAFALGLSLFPFTPANTASKAALLDIAHFSGLTQVSSMQLRISGQQTQQPVVGQYTEGFFCKSLEFNTNLHYLVFTSSNLVNWTQSDDVIEAWYTISLHKGESLFVSVLGTTNLPLP